MFNRAQLRPFAQSVFFVATSEYVRSVVVSQGTGVAWPTSMLLLGFVSHAAYDGRETSFAAPKHKSLSLLLSVSLKAVSWWCLAVGLVNTHLTSFLIILFAALVATFSVLHQGFTRWAAVWFVGSLCLLAPGIPLNKPTFQPVVGVGFLGVTLAICVGGSLALVFGVVESRNWQGMDGFWAVFVLACVGFAQNVLNPSARAIRSTSLQPATLFLSGICLYGARPKAITRSDISAWVAGFLVSMCCLWALRNNRHELIPSARLGFLSVVCSFACVVAFVNCTWKRKYADDGEVKLMMRPSLLFTKDSESKINGAVFRRLLSNPRERKLAIFLLLTVAIMWLEFLYGVHINSLGLISDSFHMMLDAASIGIGLVAAHAASWSPDEKSHPFGYGRYEVLGGFVNGVLLLFIAFYVMLESIERIIDPPEIEGPYLLLVSIIGLIVNIIGVLFFHDSHGHSHSHSHSHSHGCSSGSHVDHNMRGVYLHILADLLGSVSVILSSIFIYLFNCWIADPICSALSAALILASAFPLLEETGKILLLSGPSTGNDFSYALRQELLATGAVSDVEVPRIWMHSTAPRELMFCLIAAKLKRDSNYTKARDTIISTAEQSSARQLGVENVNIIVNFN